MSTATPGPPGEQTGTPEQTPAAEPAPITEPTNTLTPDSAVPAVPPVPPEDLIPTEKTPTLVGRVGTRVQELRSRYGKWEIAVFFFAGFLYDILTLSRIDDWTTLLQQGVYLGVLGTLLLLEQRWSGGVEPPAWLTKAWRFREDAQHFLLGSLMSSYTLFYFKSASGVTALAFLLVVFGLLVANELPRFRALGPVVRVGLFGFCVTSYLAYLLPVVLGFLSGWLFVLAVGLSSAATLGIFHLVGRWGGDVRRAMRRVAAPGLGMQAVLLGLFVVKAIPPVPLAVLSIGVYHEVEVRKGPQGNTYWLHHERPDWMVWRTGDEDFRLRPGDKAWVFASIFAPTSFQPRDVGDKGTRLIVRWFHDDPEKGWTERSTYEGLYLERGGRERGYRTFAYTSQLAPGDWRVSIETEDGREIGRKSFSVTPDERTAPREFKVDKG